MILLSHFFLMIFNKTYSFKNMSFRFSISSSKYVHFLTLVLKTILILIKFIFQRYISCRHLNFDPTYENGYDGDFLRFWKSAILGLVDHFVVCTKLFLEVIRPYETRMWNKNFLWTQIFLRDSVTGLGLNVETISLKFSENWMEHNITKICLN